MALIADNEPSYDGSGLESVKQLSAVAVTSGPGLAPCLDVGLKTAMQLSQEHGVDFVQVNHLEAHLLVSRLPDVSAKACWVACCNSLSNTPMRL